MTDVHYRASDRINSVPVSQEKPLPVSIVPATGVYTPSSATVVAPGAGYDIDDAVIVSGPDSVSETTLNVETTKVVSAAIVAGGTGGTPGEVTITGTSGTGTPFQATGVINAEGVLEGDLVVTVPGNYTVNPTSIAVEPVTGGSLSDATVIVEMGVLTVSLTTAGSVSAGTVSASQTSTEGSGTGATFTLSASEYPSLAALIGSPDDEAGDATVIGLLKQIAANTAT